MEKKKDGVLMRKIWLHIMSGRKKWGLVLLSGILAFQLLGCSPQTASEYRGSILREYDEQSDEMMQSIIEAMEEKDAEALKKLFSSYALENSENLDKKIEELLEFYPGSSGGYEGNCISDRAADYGDITLILNGTYTVNNDGQEYEVNFVTIPQNDEEPDKVGLYLIEVMTEEAEPEGFKWRNNEDAPGIYVLDPQEKQW